MYLVSTNKLKTKTNMSSLLPNCDLVAIYTMIDDAIINHSKPKIGRPSVLSDSEIITILVYNTLVLRQKSLKDILNFVKIYHYNDFPKLPRYSGFVEQAHRVIPLICEILSMTLVKAEINFTDSTMLEVCKLFRADNHKVAKDKAKFGKNHQGWHYGFKLHAAINYHGLFSSICFSGADMYDAQMLPRLIKKEMKIVVGDSHYGASVMRRHIWEKFGTIIIAPPHYKQKNKIATDWQNVLLSARSKIESVFDILKEHLHLVTSFPRSVKGYFLHYLRIILAYQFILLFKYAKVS